MNAPKIWIPYTPRCYRLVVCTMHIPVLYIHTIYIHIGVCKLGKNAKTMLKDCKAKKWKINFKQL